MFAEMKNLAQRGIPLPQTLAEAYIAASTYVVKRSAGNYEVDEAITPSTWLTMPAEAGVLVEAGLLAVEVAEKVLGSNIAHAITAEKLATSTETVRLSKEPLSVWSMPRMLPPSQTMMFGKQRI
jgi:hypothetical protein